jgi:hypothetical protein
MATMKWVMLLALLPSFSGFAEGRPFSSRFEVQQHLFNGTLSGSTTPEPFPDEGASKKKSTGLAAIYSLLLPGMGELYADGFESGKYFLIAEGVLWLTYASFEIYGNQLRDDSRAFAQARAGITTSGKEDQYFVDIGNFLDVREFNEKKLRDREPEKLYEHPSDAWRWDSDLSRATYRDQRIASENMYNNRKFVFAAIVINHVGSAINAVRAAIAYNKAMSDAVGDLDIRADVMGGWANPHGILVTLTRKF